MTQNAKKRTLNDQKNQATPTTNSPLRKKRRITSLRRDILDEQIRSIVTSNLADSATCLDEAVVVRKQVATKTDLASILTKLIHEFVGYGSVLEIKLERGAENMIMLQGKMVALHPAEDMENVEDFSINTGDNEINDLLVHQFHRDCTSNGTYWCWEVCPGFEKPSWFTTFELEPDCGSRMLILDLRTRTLASAHGRSEWCRGDNVMRCVVGSVLVLWTGSYRQLAYMELDEKKNNSYKLEQAFVSDSFERNSNNSKTFMIAVENPYSTDEDKHRKTCVFIHTGGNGALLFDSQNKMVIRQFQDTHPLFDSIGVKDYTFWVVSLKNKIFALQHMQIEDMSTTLPCTGWTKDDFRSTREIMYRVGDGVGYSAQVLRVHSTKSQIFVNFNSPLAVNFTPCPNETNYCWLDVPDDNIFGCRSQESAESRETVLTFASELDVNEGQWKKGKFEFVGDMSVLNKTIRGRGRYCSSLESMFLLEDMSWIQMTFQSKNFKLCGGTLGRDVEFPRTCDRSVMCRYLAIM